MSSFFYAIEDLFVNILFAPLDMLRFMESWWAANSINWLFMVIGSIAMVYWMIQLKIFNDNGEEDKTSTSHTYL
ncbi:Hypothetical protein I595_2941 [Croceitalea dokdonensis DOKDO 023]|uniref:Uracil phosphoribosyltransferase n=1 Tax=Croceitalea dokdonensis DOKDO 023 TaxID=1300341 RepID=A0A0P7ACN9_9FLAO|nr:hypothetical protein [Croceitalea dokdonensis]KPM30962.1 Hypothetical protein I595_2941 [Croceitalea dokdonensis DOKDO 023]